MSAQPGSPGRRILPIGVRAWLRRTARRAQALRRLLLRVSHVSTSENVYHCCAHKTASQWIRALLEDGRTYRYSGLRPYHYQTEQLGGFDERTIPERQFTEPFPSRTIVTPLYVDYDNFQAMPKPDQYRAFYVARDPRDIVVSRYFSTRFSHSPMGTLSDVRRQLNALPQTEGLRFTIDQMEAEGVFHGLRSWGENTGHDPRVMMTRFEELTGPQHRDVFQRLFEHVDVAFPDAELGALLEDYRFERLAGRSRGEEDPHSHYRKGMTGDWRHYFSAEVSKRFHEVTGDLLSVLGYE